MSWGLRKTYILKTLSYSIVLSLSCFFALPRWYCKRTMTIGDKLLQFRERKVYFSVIRLSDNYSLSVSGTIKTLREVKRSRDTRWKPEAQVFPSSAANWSVTVLNFSLSFTPTAARQKLVLANSAGKSWSGISITLSKVTKTSSSEDSKTPWCIYMIYLAAHVSKCALSVLYKNILYYIFYLNLLAFS